MIHVAFIIPYGALIRVLLRHIISQSPRMNYWHHSTMTITALPALKTSVMYLDSDSIAGDMIDTYTSIIY